jgi:hypothetical protein
MRRDCAHWQNAQLTSKLVAWETIARDTTLPLPYSAASTMAMSLTPDAQRGKAHAIPVIQLPEALLVLQRLLCSMERAGRKAGLGSRQIRRVLGYLNTSAPVEVGHDLHKVITEPCISDCMERLGRRTTASRNSVDVSLGASGNRAGRQDRSLSPTP